MLKSSRKYYNREVLHFHRWSRKVYALFVCVGKEVVIGQLKSCVAAGSLCKSRANLVLELRYLAQKFGFAVDVPDGSPDGEALADALFLVLPAIVVPSSDSCVAFKCLLNSVAVEMFSPWLFFSGNGCRYGIRFPFLFNF
ncbi:MAG: hypothetical protein WCU80_02900 [Paludibacteraceae bacterium]|nr:hypothetical protein [Prevotellaceae bacterium]